MIRPGPGVVVPSIADSSLFQLFDKQVLSPIRTDEEAKDRDNMYEIQNHSSKKSYNQVQVQRSQKSSRPQTANRLPSEREENSVIVQSERLTQHQIS